MRGSIVKCYDCFSLLLATAKPLMHTCNGSSQRIALVKKGDTNLVSVEQA